MNYIKYLYSLCVLFGLSGVLLSQNEKEEFPTTKCLDLYYQKMIQNADNELSKFEEGGKLVMDKNEKLVSIPNQNHSDYLVFYSKEELFLKNICYYHSLSTWTKESQHKKKYLSLPYE